jgi:hypothetical protein
MTAATVLRRLRSLIESADDGDADEDAIEILHAAAARLEELVAEAEDPDGEQADEPEDPAE